MKVFQVKRRFSDHRYLVEGEFRDLPVGDVVTIEFEDESRLQAVVETRTGAGVVVRSV